MRIVSLVPSLTHMLCDFGLQSKIVGCTDFCVDPPALGRTAQRVGGTKDPDLQAIAALRPTHILVNEEENKPEHIRVCQDLAATCRTFPKSPLDVGQLLRDTSRWLGIPDVGVEWALRVEAEQERLLASTVRMGSGWQGRRFLYLIWREPYMAVSQDTYIDAMLALLGMVNAAPACARYPVLSVSDIQGLHPDVVFFSSEPYPFRQRDMERFASEWHLEARGEAAMQRPSLRKIDGKLLSWYGTMTALGLRHLRALLEGPPASVSDASQAVPEAD